MNDTINKVEPKTNDNSTDTKVIKKKKKGKKKINTLEKGRTKSLDSNVHEFKGDTPSKEVGTNNGPLSNEKMKEEINKEKKGYYGKFLVAIVFIIIMMEYYTYVYEMKYRNMTNDNKFSTFVLIGGFHVLFFLMIWSLITVMLTNPGEIPLYWGFYIGDEDYKRKRYCLLCNAFKPDRAHHCSICNVCVLNMDHHCPWVNNCIGFYNRRFFIQLLCYFMLIVLYIDFTCANDVYKAVLIMYRHRHSAKYALIFRSSLIILCYLITCVLSLLNSMFFKFHLMLVLKNSTTIESLDPQTAVSNKYNLGIKENWMQVFGPQTLYWFFPIVNEKSMPKGDGLTWETHQTELPEPEDIAKTKEKLPISSDQENNLKNKLIQLGTNFSTNYKSNPAVLEESTGQPVGVISPTKLQMDLTKLDTPKHNPNTILNLSQSNIQQLLEMSKIVKNNPQ